jgi:hypothetical protein
MNISKEFYISAKNAYFSEVDFLKMSDSEFDAVMNSLSEFEKFEYDTWAFHSNVPCRLACLLPKEIREHNARCVRAHLDHFGL